MAEVVALKVAELAAAGTVTDAGTVRAASVLVRVTAAPAAGETWFRVTVQVLEELGPRLVGLQTSEETSTVGARVMVALAELLL
jgi:hypothetical protein